MLNTMTTLDAVLSLQRDVEATMAALDVDERTALTLELIYRQTIAHLAGNRTAEIGFSAAAAHAAGQMDADTMREIWDIVGFGGDRPSNEHA